MNKRDFITMLGGAATAWPLAARAQQPERMRRIGIIDYTPMWEPLRDALREFGYVEGQNIAFEYRSAASEPERLSTAAAELVHIPVDVIVTYGTPATAAAKQATTRIPIVMVGPGNPVESGLVSSLARPGGNVTGNTILGPEVVATVYYRRYYVTSGCHPSRAWRCFGIQKMFSTPTTSSNCKRRCQGWGYR